MNKIEELVNATRLNKFLKKEEKKNAILTGLAVVGVIVLVGVVIYGIIKCMNKDYDDDLDMDFDDEDEFDDDFFEEDFDC